MAFSLQWFAEVRPCLYHLTAAGNVGRVRERGCLESAESLLKQAGEVALQYQRRASHRTIDVGGVAVSLRDQARLYERNIEFEDGWALPQLVALLNQRVFFWPGTVDGPRKNGLRHFNRYEAERPAVIRVRTSSLFRANSGSPPLFCRFNAGSPRCSGGSRSPRGVSTFQTASANGYSPKNVVEVTFVGNACLPDDAELRGASWGEWAALFPPAAVPDIAPSDTTDHGVT